MARRSGTIGHHRRYHIDHIAKRAGKDASDALSGDAQQARKRVAVQTLHHLAVITG
jgi:hypothetical protein